MGVKYTVNEKYFDEWSSNMAYILGFLYADGSLEKSPKIRGRYMRVTSTDKSVIDYIKQSLKSGHTITLCQVPQPGSKPRFLLRIGSHKLFTSLSSHGLHPNKSLNIQFPKKIPSAYLPHFIRGYFDGDGCVHLSKALGKSSLLIVKRLTIIFTSGSKCFLEEMEEILRRNAPINRRPVYASHRSFQLRYSTADSIELFKYMYNNSTNQFYLDRKLKTFIEYFKLRPKRIDTRINEILKYSKHYGPVAK